MTKDPIEQLPAKMARRNWIIFALLLAGSLLFANRSLTLGVLAGGLVAIGGFYWLRNSLGKLLKQPTGGARFRYQFGYLVRLSALAAALAILVAVVKINPIGLIFGLSVVVINLFCLTLERAFK